MKKLVKIYCAIFFGFASLMLNTSCNRENSNDVNQDKIYTTYSLVYDANEDKTYARAIFQFSNALGTQLELTSPSDVHFNNDILTFKSGLAYYEKEYAGKVTTGTFTWKDTDGSVYTNSVSIKSIDFPVVLDTIHRTAAYEMFWVGDSLSANHSVTVTINGVLEGDAQYFSQDNINSKSIILAKSQLELLGQGMGTIWMQRIYTPGLLQKTSAGGAISGKYIPVTRHVYLK